MMKKIMIAAMISCAFALPSLANTVNDDHRFEKTEVTIKNSTSYPVTMTMNYTDGTWEKPLTLNVPILLNSSESYQNTLISLNKDGVLENFASLEVAQVGNARENYLIFGETTSSHNQEHSADIFDGLGNIFVDSATNYCHAETPEGYGQCELVVKDNPNVF